VRLAEPRALLLLALLLSWPGSGRAFLIQTVAGSRGPVEQRWPQADRGVPFLLDQAGSDDLPRDTTHQILRASFRAWERVPRSSIRFLDQGVTSALDPDQEDRRNLVIFDETGAWLGAPPGTGIIAITRTRSDVRTGSLLDADIIFNGRDYRFSSSAQDGRVELRDVAVHEIGHLLGLDHTPLGGPPETRPTMNPFYSTDGPGQASTLEADDRTGASVLYPSESFAAQTGSITGQVADSSGIALAGVHVVAEELGSGELVSTLSGAYPQAGGQGWYQLHGLSPGTYRMLLTPVAENLTPASFGARFAFFPGRFAPEYYDNTPRPDVARRLALQVGLTLSGIDFLTGLRRPGFPFIDPLFLPNNTPDPTGPYQLRLQVQDAERLVLRYRTESTALPRDLPMAQSTPGEYRAGMPGQSPGTRLYYQVEADNALGNATYFPAQDQWLDFEVVRLSGAPLVYVALREEDAVGIIDTRDHRVLARIAAGDEPIQALLSPDRTYLYVSCLASGEVLRISTSTFQLVDRFRVADQPLDIAFSADGRTLYAAGSGTSSLSVINLGSGAVHRLSLPSLTSGPYGLAVAGLTVYVTDLEGGQVLALDTQGTIQATIPVAGEPRSLALSPDHRTLYVTSFSRGLLTAIDVASNQVTRSMELPFQGTFAVAPNPDGSRVYVTAHADGAVGVVDPVAGTVLQVLDVGADPRGLSFSPSGDQLFVTSSATGRIAVIDVAAGRVLESFDAGQGPRGLAVVASPLVADAGSGPGDGSLPNTFGLAPAFPNPFNSATQISYSLDAGVLVTLRIHNPLGQWVRALVRQEQAAGYHRVAWDGRDDMGNAVASGVYVVLLETPARQASRKVLLLR
jgi:YVTN family beta-propeller protein